MINVKELRIGNYILLDLIGLPQWHQVQSQDIVDITNGRITLSSIEPIPLTTELLSCVKGIKSNFTTDPQERNASKLYDINGVLLHQHDECINRFYFYVVDITLEVTSLHQLQNLYFALTQTELNIQL